MSGLASFLYSSAMTGLGLAVPAVSDPLSQQILSQNHKTQVIIYPASKTVVNPHAQLGTGGNAYNCVSRYRRLGPLDESEAIARRPKKRAYVRFIIRDLPAERIRLESFLFEREKRPALQSCISGIFRALQASHGFSVPFPLNHSPTWSSLYLYVLSKIPGSRVESAEYVGTRPKWETWVKALPALCLDSLIPVGMALYLWDIVQIAFEASLKAFVWLPY